MYKIIDKRKVFYYEGLYLSMEREGNIKLPKNFNNDALFLYEEYKYYFQLSWRSDLRQISNSSFWKEYGHDEHQLIITKIEDINKVINMDWQKLAMVFKSAIDTNEIGELFTSQWIKELFGKHSSIKYTSHTHLDFVDDANF